MPSVYSYHRLQAGFEGEIDEEMAGARDYSAQHLETRGYQWGGHFVDVPATRATPLFSRTEGRRLSRTIHAGDILLVPRLSTGFSGAADLLSVARFAQQRPWHLAVAEVRYYSWNDDAESVLESIQRQAVAEKEREAEHARAGQATRRERGRLPNQHAGGYGFKLVGPPGRRRIAPDPEEQATMREILSLRQEGLSVGQIARALMLAGVVTRTGREWSPSRVIRALPAARRLFSADLGVAAESTATPAN